MKSEQQISSPRCDKHQSRSNPHVSKTEYVSVFEVCDRMSCPCIKILPLLSLFGLPLFKTKVMEEPFRWGLVFGVALLTVMVHFLNYVHLFHRLLKHMEGVLEGVMMGRLLWLHYCDDRDFYVLLNGGFLDEDCHWLFGHDDFCHIWIFLY